MTMTALSPLRLLVAAFLLGAVAMPPAAVAAGDCPNLVINTEWDVGVDCTLQFVVDHEAHGWEIQLTFDSPLTSLDCWQVHCQKGFGGFRCAFVKLNVT